MFFEMCLYFKIDDINEYMYIFIGVYVDKNCGKKK